MIFISHSRLYIRRLLEESKCSIKATAELSCRAELPSRTFCLQCLFLEIARPLESQLKVEFLGVPYNQTFDFVTGLFVKILTPACS